MNDDKRIYLCLSLTIPPHFPNLWSIIEAMVTIVELCLTLPSIHDYCHLVQSKWLYEQSQAPWLDFLATALPPGAVALRALPSCTCGTRKQQRIYVLRVLALPCPANSLYGLASSLTRRKAEGTPFAVHSIPCHGRGRLKAINLFALRLSVQYILSPQSCTTVLLLWQEGLSTLPGCNHCEPCKGTRKSLDI